MQTILFAANQVQHTSSQKAQEAAKLSDEEFPNELLLRLQHMIVSHHGKYEFGSPTLPMTPEAIATN